MSIIIMRKACLPEDEGRVHFQGMYKTREEANKWLEAQKGEYFRLGDYYTIEVTNEIGDV